MAACAAQDGDRNAVLLSHFEEDDASEPLQALVREEIVTDVSAASYLTLPVFTTYPITIEPAALDG